MSATPVHASSDERRPLPRGWAILGIGLAGWSGVALGALAAGLIRF